MVERPTGQPCLLMLVVVERSYEGTAAPVCHIVMVQPQICTLRSNGNKCGGSLEAWKQGYDEHKACDRAFFGFLEPE
jgi:hypothetical protein